MYAPRGRGFAVRSGLSHHPPKPKQDEQKASARALGLATATTADQTHQPQSEIDLEPAHDSAGVVRAQLLAHSKSVSRPACPADLPKPCHGRGLRLSAGLPLQPHRLSSFGFLYLAVHLSHDLGMRYTVDTENFDNAWKQSRGKVSEMGQAHEVRGASRQCTATRCLLNI